MGPQGHMPGYQVPQWQGPAPDWTGLLRSPEESADGYLGCYVDDGARDFRYGPKTYGYDQDRCRTACKQYKFFALQHTGWCNCDNEYSTPKNKYSERDDRECGGAS